MLVSHKTTPEDTTMVAPRRNTVSVNKYSVRAQFWGK
jgi:hypothetical protein